MNLKNTKNKDVEVSLTPLIDVVFLLLIFFMVSTSFTKESEIQVELPEAASAKKMQADDFLNITIDREGIFFVNNNRVINRNKKTLKKAIQKIIENNSDITLMINADAETSHQSVVTAMDVARELGIYKMSLGTNSSVSD